MPALLILLLLFFSGSLLASGKIILDIQPPRYEIIDLEPESCDHACLGNHLQKGEFFSFVARYSSAIHDEMMHYQFTQTTQQLDILPFLSHEEAKPFRLAVIVPKQVIGKYALTTTKSLLSYLLNLNEPFEIKTFNSGDESADSLANVLQDIEQQQFPYTIAILTKEGAHNLLTYQGNTTVYIPTVHRNELDGVPSEKLIFGGISYQEQIAALDRFSANRVAIYYDGSPLSVQLNHYITGENRPVLFEKTIDSNRISQYRSHLRSYQDSLPKSSVYLNTPVVQSGLIMSQLTYHKAQPYNLLSTQINYNPVLFSLTQPEDREKLYIANSIGHLSDGLAEHNSLLESEIRFDWINYSTSLGADLLYTLHNPAHYRLFNESLQENQVLYGVTVQRMQANRFLPAHPELP